MEVKEAIKQRISVRAFRPDPAPREVLEELLAQSLWAPSWGNTQPWKLTLVSGRALDRIREGCVRMAKDKVETNPDLMMPRPR